jgi:D-sedoheptulose 7-phosphate isomerase
LNPEQYLLESFEDSVQIQKRFLQENSKTLLQVAEALGTCIAQGGKILIFGNGGSAADAQHMAAEMVGRMLIERRPLPAIALTTDTSNLTAVGNDYGFESIFLRQIQALARKGDVVVAFSTSGNSKNVLRACEEARRLGCKIVGLTGGDGGALKKLSDLCLNASAGKTSSRIQEAHAFAIHSMVDLLDRFFLKGERA